MWFYLAAALIVAGIYFLFKDTMNRLQYIGPVYWITRDNGDISEPRICRAFMRGTSAPFKVGQGVQFRLFYYTFQIGICRNAPVQGEMEGLMYVLGAHDLEDSPLNSSDAIPLKDIRDIP